MTQAVYNNLEDWNEITGGQLMNEYSWIGWGHQFGDRGQLEYQDSVGTVGAYKYDGVVKFIYRKILGRDLLSILQPAAGRCS